MCTVSWSPDGIIAAQLERRAICIPFFRGQRRDRTSVTNWNRGKTKRAFIYKKNSVTAAGTCTGGLLWRSWPQTERHKNKLINKLNYSFYDSADKHLSIFLAFQIEMRAHEHATAVDTCHWRWSDLWQSMKQGFFFQLFENVSSCTIS